MNKKNTIYDIAERASVSTTTVYKVMNNLKGVSEARRQEILQIAKEMGYEGNSVARTLARKEFRIGIVCEALNSFSILMMDGLKAAFKYLKNYKVEMIVAETGEDIGRERVLKNFEKMLQGDVDGIILFPSVPYQDYETFNKEIAKKKLPVVTVINEVPHLDALTCIRYHGESLGRLAGDLMNIACPNSSYITIIGNKDVAAQQHTIAGFKDVVEKNGGTLANSYENQYIEDVNNYIVDDIVKSYSYASGIFVGVSQSTNVIERLRSLGRLDQFKIITVDNSPFIDKAMQNGEVTATLNRQPYKIGQIAVNTLYSYLSNGAKPDSKILLPSSVVLPSSIEDDAIQVDYLMSIV